MKIVHKIYYKRAKKNTKFTLLLIIYTVLIQSKFYFKKESIIYIAVGLTDVSVYALQSPEYKAITVYIVLAVIKDFTLKNKFLRTRKITKSMSQKTTKTN